LMRVKTWHSYCMTSHVYPFKFITKYHKQEYLYSFPINHISKLV